MSFDWLKTAWMKFWKQFRGPLGDFVNDKFDEVKARIVEIVKMHPEFSIDQLAAESRPSSATHSAPNGASFVSAISAAPFLTRGRG